MSRILALGLLVLVIGGCASEKIKKPNSKIALTGYLDLTKSESKGEWKKYWKRANRARLIYPRSARRNHVAGCVEITFGINSDGQVEGYRVTKSYPEGVFDKSAAINLKNRRWEPTDENVDRQSVLTTDHFNFRVDNPSNLEGARKECRKGKGSTAGVFVRKVSGPALKL